MMTPGDFSATTIDDLSDDALEHLDEMGLLSEEEFDRQFHRRVSPRDIAIIDAFAYGLARLLNTPINQLVAETAQERARMGVPPIVGSRAGVWSNQAVDYALNTDSTYVATAYMKAPPERIYDPRARWVVYAMPSRQDLDAWFGRAVAASSLYHYIAVFDKTAPEWSQGRPVASSVEEADARVSGLFDDITNALKGAVSSVTSFVHHPPGWFAAVMPLFTMENQRYWAEKLGGSTGAQLYDAGVKVIASQYLGPQGPALVDAYNKVTEDAAKGNLNAKEILSKAPQIAKLAAASKQGPDAFRAAVASTKSAVKVSGEGERAMRAYDHVGADGQSYPEIAARAVQGVHQQSASPVYGYLRAGTQQKIYLFGAIEDAQGWLTSLTHGQSQPYDYAAVFAATDLSRPVTGLESFGHTFVSGDTTVGQIWPFFLGLPLGGLAGYLLRRWQEDNPGHTLPFVPPGKLPPPHIPGQPPASGAPSSGPPAKTAGEYATVGGPWLDMEPVYSIAVVGCHHGDGDEGYTIGGPWLDVVGAQIDDRARRAWPQTKALIHSAIREVSDASRQMPGASAFVWSLDPPSTSYAGVTLEGTTGILSFNSTDEALDYMRSRIQTPHVALALFDRTSAHWPNPTNWTKSNDPSYEPVIAQQAAKYAPVRAAGSHVGAWPTSIGSALDDVRTRAQSLATKRDGRVIGVIHTAKDNLWHALAFTHADDADDWLGTATHDPAAYTYAAYYDKDDFSWPHPVNEKIGGARQRSQPGESIRRGAAVAGYRGA